MGKHRVEYIDYVPSKRLHKRYQYALVVRFLIILPKAFPYRSDQREREATNARLLLSHAPTNLDERKGQRESDNVL